MLHIPGCNLIQHLLKGMPYVDLVELSKMIEIEKNTRDAKEGRVSDEEMELIKSNRMIDAIKAIRARTDLGLKEAKDLVDKVRGNLLAKPMTHSEPPGRTIF